MRVLKYITNLILFIGIFIVSDFYVEARELKCNVEVNSDLIEGTNKSVFNALQQSISDYLNETEWSNTTFSPTEWIECNFFLTVKEYSGNKISGDLQVQLVRPVYNSTYTTLLFNYKDTKIEFDYREGDQLVFNDRVWDNNLTGILNFYAFLFLALDFDSFSLQGGQPFFDKAASIVQQAQSSGENGWKLYDDSRSRGAVLSAFTDPSTRAIRDLMYQYHRKGLDEMATNPDKGRLTITKSLETISEIYEKAPMSVVLSLFRDAKLDELINIYSHAPQSEREKVYEILQTVFPTDYDRLEKIRKPDEK